MIRGGGYIASSIESIQRKDETQRTQRKTEDTEKTGLTGGERFVTLPCPAHARRKGQSTAGRSKQRPYK